ncbi:Glycoside hydrolase, family 32 [gut metagenome]|uniref:beta-fructofuranosidase n=1 Tax=gut metagenome TaxID=749906 RepID=J9GRW7_9ZZZZ
MMKNFIAIMLLGLLSFPWQSASAQKTWSFDETDPLCSDDGQSWMKLSTVKPEAEWVPGFEGRALRTDGYSTWLSTEIDANISAASGWFALESYPTDTASFVGIRNLSGVSVAVCADRYGELLLGIGRNGLFSYHSLKTKIERFQWLHLALDLENKQVYFNGQKLLPEVWPEQLHVGKYQLQLGKDFREKKVGMYTVTAINGLMDEITLSYHAVDELSLKHSIALGLQKTPVLAIPESRFAKDFNRPRYHLLPAANWTNETHGLIYYQGKYHIFNQKNASSIFLGQINWGHFTSPDLLHWTEEKPALTPSQNYDKNGIWSGHAVIDDEGVLQLIYTAGGDKLGVGIAFPKDSLLVDWEKYIGNPVIAEKPEAYTRTDMRDQYVWKEGDTWYMIIGYGIEKPEPPHGALLLYKSVDLKDWKFVHLLFEGNPSVDQTGVFWEMPVFKKLGNKYLLSVNRVPHKGIPARCQYWIGDFKGEKFIPDHPIPNNLEVINRLLSPSVAVTPRGELVATIIPDEIGEKASYMQGWAHVYSMPRKWVLKNGKLCQSPHPVMQQLRDNRIHYSKRLLPSSRPLLVSRNEHQLEVRAVFYPNDARQFGFTLCKNPDNGEYSRIYYDVEKQKLVVDQSHSSLRPGIPLNIRQESYPLDTQKPVEIRLFIDGSVVEGFINNEDAFTTRIFPSQAESAWLELYSDGKTTEVEVELWKLNDAKVKANF